MSKNDILIYSSEKLSELYCPGIEIDYYIMAAGYNSRTYAAYNSLLENGATIHNTIVMDYAENRPDTKDNLARAMYYSYQSTPGVIYKELQREESEVFLCKEVLLEGKNIYVDITEINIPDLFRFFFILKEICFVKTLSVLYTEPNHYKYQDAILFDYGSHNSEYSYAPIREYFTSAGSRSVILICFLGFEKLISKKIYEEGEYYTAYAVNGFPSFYPKLKDISLECNYEFISTIGMDCIRYVQANDPFSVYNLLIEIMNRNSDSLLDICVLGSKPMALGACMFALKHNNNAKVSYPFHKRIPFKQTHDVGEIWRYDFIL